jgi:hypothetical protein
LPNRAHPSARLDGWTVSCIDSAIAGIVRLACTITTWREESLVLQRWPPQQWTHQGRQPADQQIKRDSETAATIGRAELW